MAEDKRAAEEVLMTDLTAEGLRRLASDIGVERASGATKAETVDRLMEEAEGEVRDRLQEMGYELRGPAMAA